MIDTSQTLADFLPAVRSAAWLALDTEADSLHAYPEKLCLLQISLPGHDVLVDPLAGLDLRPLFAALDGRELILHGADYDLRMLHRSLGFVPHAVFDTMLAARLLGEVEFGLTHLVARELGVALEKGPQKANWAQRPLNERLTTYARNDTRHLKPLTDILRQKLAASGRLEWHRQMCDQLIRDCTQPRVDDPDTAWRVKGANRLSRRALAVVRELWQWREHEAIRANLPPFFVLRHDTLVALAEAAAQGRETEGLIPARYSPARRTTLTHAIERARALPEAKLPFPLRNHGPRMSPAAKQRQEVLRQKRDLQASRLGLDPTLIASRAVLSALGRDWEENQGALLPWQRELLAT